MADAAVTRCSIDAVLIKSPHGANFHVFATEPAVLPLFDPWGKFPTGSLILKEKLDRKSDKTELFTGMWKREPGYFPEAGDWEFFTVDAGATRLVERGKLPRCASCHEEYGKGDYVSKLYALPGQLQKGRIVLHSSRAVTHGEDLRYFDGELKNALGNWITGSDWASWAFTVDQPCTYQIQLWQGCGVHSGGSVVTVSCAGQTSTFNVEETGHFQKFVRRTVGKVTFEKAGPQKLEVRAKTKPGAAVMDLRQIILVPDPAPKP